MSGLGQTIYEEGLEVGREGGRAEGRAEGHAEGHAEGFAEAITFLLNAGKISQQDAENAINASKAVSSHLTKQD